MFHCFNLSRFSVDTAKNIKFLGNTDDNTLEIFKSKFRAETYGHYMFIVWSYVHNLFQFGAMINCWMKWVLLLRNKYIVFCVFRTLWLVSHTLLPNTCSKLNIVKNYIDMLIVVKVNNKNTRICNAVFIFHFQHIQQINLIFLI